MSATNSFETSFLALLFNNDAITGIGDAGGLLPSAAEGSLYIAMFTQDPGEAGAVANECVYGSYARVAVARNDTEWSVVDNLASNINTITFPECSSGTETATYVGIMSGVSGDNMLISLELTSPLMIAAGVQPQFSANELRISMD